MLPLAVITSLNLLQKELATTVLTASGPRIKHEYSSDLDAESTW